MCFCLGGALLSGDADGFELGLGGGRVGHVPNGLNQPHGDVGNSVGFGLQQVQQPCASHPDRCQQIVGQPSWPWCRPRRQVVNPTSAAIRLATSKRQSTVPVFRKGLGGRRARFVKGPHVPRRKLAQRILK
jgi:hypothetical protein